MLVAGQAAIAAVVALVFGATYGLASGLAAAIGGGIGVAGSLAQVASGFRRSTAGDARAIARGFYRGEALKIGITVLLFVLALRGRRWAPVPLFVGYVSTFVAYWVALLRTTGARGA